MNRLGHDPVFLNVKLIIPGLQYFFTSDHSGINRDTLLTNIFWGAASIVLKAVFHREGREDRKQLAFHRFFTGQHAASRVVIENLRKYHGHTKHFVLNYLIRILSVFLLSVFL
jgi:hypothetical protein